MEILPFLSRDMDGFDGIPAAGRLLYLLGQVCAVGSLSDLARRAGISERNAFRLARLLRQHRWLRMEDRGNISIPIPIIPRVEDERRAALLRTCYEVSQYKGEFILRTTLETVAFLEGAVYNARPGFLKHPVSGEKLEYDVFNPATMDAWELQGFQHFGPSEVFPSPEKAKQQQANDYIKLGKSMMNGINVIVLTYKDLSVDGILRTLPKGLPRRPIDRSSKFVRALESIATSYRQWAARVERKLRAKAKAATQLDGDDLLPSDWMTMSEAELEAALETILPLGASPGSDQITEDCGN